MPRPRTLDEPDDARVRPRDRSWSTRLAWLVLLGGAGIVVTRMAVATVVQLHGDGMAPTLLDGDHVVLLRGRWSIERGDVVVYDPTPPPRGEPLVPPPPERDAPRADNDEGEQFPDARRDPQNDLRNTAVVDPDDLEEGWSKVQARADGIATGFALPSLRLGRVLAMPGDRVAFHVPGAALGLAIDGIPLTDKVGDPMRLRLVDPELTEDERPGGDGPDAEGRMRSVAWETCGDRRYPVLPSAHAEPAWTAIELPPASAGPVEIQAEGYLVLADNRDDGACCDSRALGWIRADAIRGEVVARLSGSSAATPDLAPGARGVLWKP
jgi:signal peptidase I